MQIKNWCFELPEFGSLNVWENPDMQSCSFLAEMGLSIQSRPNCVFGSESCLTHTTWVDLIGFVSPVIQCQKFLKVQPKL